MYLSQGSRKMEEKGSDGEDAHVPGAQPGVHTIDVALIEVCEAQSDNQHASPFL
jgi:hypothetical protein